MEKRLISFLLIISIIVLPIMVSATEINQKINENRENDNDLVHYDEIPVLTTMPETTRVLFETNNIRNNFEMNKKTSR